MDRRLHLLDSFPAQGADGVAYKVMAYEHLAKIELATADEGQWEPTGQTEYRLSTGERVDVAADGSMKVQPSGLVLRRQAA